MPLTEALDHQQQQGLYASPKLAPPKKRGNVKKVQKSGCGPICMFLVGLVMLFIFLPAGIVFIAVAIVFDSVNHYFACSACGNQLAKGAKLCPTCGAELK